MIDADLNSNEGDWGVTIFYIGSDNHTNILDGVSEKIARKIYNQLKEEMKRKGDFIEVKTGENVGDCEDTLRFIVKKNISHIKLFDP